VHCLDQAQLPLNFVNTHWSAPCEVMNLASNAGRFFRWELIGPLLAGRPASTTRRVIPRLCRTILRKLQSERSRRHGPAHNNPQTRRHNAVNAARLQKRKGHGAARKGRPFFIAV
jgi:hypothetical protein